MSNPELISTVSVSCDVTTFLDLTSFRHLPVLFVRCYALLRRNNVKINVHVETENGVKHQVRLIDP